MTTMNKVWTARAQYFEDLEPQIQTFLDAHPTITITDTQFFQSLTDAQEHNVAIFYKVPASSGMLLSTLLRAIRKYASAYNVDFDTICEKIKVDCTALGLPENDEKARLYHMMQAEKKKEDN